MDFQQLMKQASANQSSAQRRHEFQKKQIEDMKRKEESEKREKIKKASALLQDLKKNSEKKQLEYRGIVNSRAAEFERAVVKASLSSSSSSSHRKATLDRTTATNGGPHTPGTSSGKQGAVCERKPQEASKSTKGKAKLSEKDNPVQKNSPSASGSKPSTASKSLTTTKSHSSTASRSSTVSGTTAKCHRAPVNFQELMKLADQKRSVEDSALGRLRGGECAPSQRGVGGGVVPGKKGVRTDGSPAERGQLRRSKSPLGKQLLEKTSFRSKQKIADGARERVGEERMCGRSEPRDCTGRGSHEPAMDRATVGTNLRELAKSRVVGRGSKTGNMTGSTTGNKTGSMTGSKTGCDRGSSNGEVCSAGRQKELPESAVVIRERFRRELEASANGSKTNLKTTTSVKSNSFYGSAHAKLSKEGRPSFPRKTRPGSVAGPYQSSWAREMSEYVEQLREGEETEEGYSDEDDDGLDDFVVDDEGDDVSSAIRAIFGYDKRRYRDEDDDDRMMESSFAQQQYEEMRSSRIGRQEDEEDLRREAERLTRKRRKGGSPQGLKQSKLSFR